MEALNKALDAISYEWLMEQHPLLVEAIESELKKGATPRGIKHAVLSQTQRLELALRCEQTARHLVRE
jgi:hypothetical protein